MNLHALVRGAITAVNPDISGRHIRNLGYTILPGGKQVPNYKSAEVRLQVQGVNGSDLKHLDALNIQGVLRTVFMYGNSAGVVRADGTGGDLINFRQNNDSDDQTWKIVMVKEVFPDWCCVIVQLQTQLVNP